jgi:hypothetical protein
MIENILLFWEILALLYVVINGKVIYQNIPLLMVILGLLFSIISKEDYLSMNNTIKILYDILGLIYFLSLNFFVYKILKIKYSKVVNVKR